MDNGKRANLAAHWRKVIKAYDKLQANRPLTRKEMDQRYLAKFNLDELYEKGLGEISR